MKRLLILSLIFMSILTISCDNNSKNIINNYISKVNVEEVKENINEYDTELLLEQYNNLNKEDKIIIDNLIKENVDNKYKEFCNGELEISETFEYVRRYENIKGVKEYINKIRSDMNEIIKNQDSIEESKKNYSIAEEFFYDESYENALDRYNKIVEQSEYYEDAQKKKEICESYIWEKAEEYFNKEWYGDAYDKYILLINSNKYSELAKKNIEIVSTELQKINKEKELKEKIENRNNLPEPWIGMLESQIDECSWGKPDKINETITKYKTTKQYVYSNNKYLYFDDGILTTIQK